MDEINHHQAIQIEHICRRFFNLSSCANIETVQILSTLITLTALNGVLFQIENTPLEPGQQWHEIIPNVNLKQQNVHANVRIGPYSDLQPVYALRSAMLEHSIVNMRHIFPKEILLYIEALHAYVARGRTRGPGGEDWKETTYRTAFIALDCRTRCIAYRILI